VRIEREAGVQAGFTDEAYAAAGARVGTVGQALEGAEVVAAVRCPGLEASDRLPRGALLVALLQPARSRPLLERLAARGVHAMAMENVPRTARAQAAGNTSMLFGDAKASLATLVHEIQAGLGAGRT
jgi:H+-translocating NAD(P) transhydrogenase subunit alpha